MSKNTFPRVAERGSGLSYQLTPNIKVVMSCYVIAIFLRPALPGAKYGPDWARTSDPALIKRML